MADHPVSSLNALYLAFRNRKIGRRELIARASALGISGVVLSRLFGPVGTSAQTTSIDRKTWRSTLYQAFPFTRKPEAEKTGGVVTYGRMAPSVVTTTNLLLAGDGQTQSILGLIQEYLVSVSPIDGAFAPGLADSWEISDDGLTYTFNLNRKARWHDDTAFTADDVIFSFDSQTNRDIGSPFQASFTSVVDAYRKIDDNTVELVATDVFAPVVFLANALTPILPKHLWGSVDAAGWQDDPGSVGLDAARVVGTGPFKFRSLSETGDVLTLERNGEYYEGEPLISRLVFQSFTDQSDAVNALKDGKINILERVPPDDLVALDDNDAFTVTIYDTNSFIWYGTNLDASKTPLFQDVSVRQALLQGLDRDAMIEEIMDGFAEVADGTQPLLSVAYAPDEISTIYGHTPNAAARLLDDAGWTLPDGAEIREKDGVPLSFEILHDRDAPQIVRAVEMMQSDWQAIGIEATPKPVDYNTELLPALTSTFDFQMVALGFTWDGTGDQSPMFGFAYKGDGYNAVGYSNPEFDQLADEANHETDPDARRDLLIQAANIVNDDLPIGILWFRRDGTVNQSTVHNFVPNGYSTVWSLRWTWIE
jgi:peptide/nickel transport system substrate-binding protein